MFILFVVVVVLFAIVTTMLFASLSREAQLKRLLREEAMEVAYAKETLEERVNEWQKEVADILALRTVDQEVISNKDLHIAGLVKELNTKERRLNDLIFRNEALELRVKEVCSTSDELYRALKEATK